LAQPASDLIVLASLGAGLGIAAFIDVRERRIPNVVCAATAAAGLTLLSSVAGLALGLALMLPGHIFGGTGAGDVKLFAAAGTLLGAGRMVPAFLFVALAGGVLAIAIAVGRQRLPRTLALTAQMCSGAGDTKAAIESPIEHNRFPYGPAIAVGCVFAALIR
jgi:prepilin peptidase CpaA